MLPIPLQNASNLRDLGGPPTRLRPGLVFRAPALINLSPADEATIAALGLRTVCDLRGGQERARHPVSIPGTTNLSLPIEPSVGASLKDILRTGQASGHISPAEMLDLLREAYRDYALQRSAQYRTLFAHVLRDDGLPLLLHCSAGKDRTGFGSALLLTALGEPWEVVMADYLATNTQWKREIGTNFDLPAPLKEVLFDAHDVLLTAAFDAIRERYGSVDTYLERAIGLDAAARAQLADRLLLA
jgi:protein-tyrosine phosphatase